jgi:hypothetical protein
VRQVAVVLAHAIRPAGEPPRIAPTEDYDLLPDPAQSAFCDKVAPIRPHNPLRADRVIRPDGARPVVEVPGMRFRTIEPNIPLRRIAYHVASSKIFLAEQGAAKQRETIPLRIPLEFFGH